MRPTPIVFAALGWTASVCLSVGGKERQQSNGILRNTKLVYIKFPPKCHRVRRRVCAAGEDGQRWTAEKHKQAREGEEEAY